MGVIWTEGKDREVKGTEGIAPHTHCCKNCGEVFTATCGHRFYSHKPNGSVTHREAVPSEFPYYVNSCPKPECTWKGF